MPWLKLSARIIHWPAICACCCESANTTIKAAFTRISGTQRKKADERFWDIPYCTRCLEHQEEVLWCKRKLADAMSRLRKAGQLTVTGVPFAIAGIIFGALLFAGSCAAIAAILPERDSTSLRLMRATVIGIPSLLPAILAWLAVAFSFPSVVRFLKVRRDDAVSDATKKLRSAEDSLHIAQQLLRPTCNPIGPAVVYHGWEGTVHTFEMHSSRYAELVATANKQKMVT